MRCAALRMVILRVICYLYLELWICCHTTKSIEQDRSTKCSNAEQPHVVLNFFPMKRMNKISAPATKDVTHANPISPQQCKLHSSLSPSPGFSGWTLKPFRTCLVPPRLSCKHRQTPRFLTPHCIDVGAVPANNTPLPEQHFAPTLQLLWADINEDTRWEMGQVGNIQRCFSFIVWYFHSSHKQAALVSFPRKINPTRGCYIVWWITSDCQVFPLNWLAEKNKTWATIAAPCCLSLELSQVLCNPKWRKLHSLFWGRWEGRREGGRETVSWGYPTNQDVASSLLTHCPILEPSGRDPAWKSWLCLLGAGVDWRRSPWCWRTPWCWRFIPCFLP